MKRLMMVGVSLLMMVQPAAAGELNPYVKAAAGVSSMNLEITGVGEDQASSAGGFIGLGADYGDYLGAEVRLGTTGSGQVTIGGVRYELQTEWFISYLGKVQGPISDNLAIYALIGGTTQKQKNTIVTPGWIWTATGTTVNSKTVTNFTLGFGMDYTLESKDKVGIELTGYGSGLVMLTAHYQFGF